MKSLSFAVSAIGIVALLTSALATAQQQRAMAPQLHAVNPSLSLSEPATGPLEGQIRQDYATGLSGAQRELLQQNPSGLGRQEQAIGRELNGYIAPR